MLFTTQIRSLTAIPVSLPLIAPGPVAVRLCAPAVFSVTGKLCTPFSEPLNMYDNQDVLEGTPRGSELSSVTVPVYPRIAFPELSFIVTVALFVDWLVSAVGKPVTATVASVATFSVSVPAA